MNGFYGMNLESSNICSSLSSRPLCFYTVLHNQHCTHIFTLLAVHLIYYRMFLPTHAALHHRVVFIT
jgi:hypothetical protein